MIIGLCEATLVEDVVSAAVSSGCLLLGLLLLMAVATRWSEEIVGGRQSAAAFGRIQVPRATAVRLSLALLAVGAASAGAVVLFASLVGASR